MCASETVILDTVYARWKAMGNFICFSSLRVKEKDSRWLYYPLSSKWASIKFRALTIRSNMDIYCVVVSMWAKESKVISVSPRSLVWSSRGTGTVSRRSIQHHSRCGNSSTQEPTALSYLWKGPPRSSCWLQKETSLFVLTLWTPPFLPSFTYVVG